ncbi:MAG: chromate transporter [Acidobacteria bacterium]|nr:chromate transporter [Acidobacteriota bacterium]
MKDTVKFSDALRFWLRLGLISFGGPAGQIAIMQKELVETRKWIAHDEFLHALNFCMLLPGPEAQQLATYIGWKLHGYRGGLAAGALFVIPSIILLLGLSFVYAAFGRIAEVGAVLNGFKAVVVAIVVEAVFKIAGRSLSSARHILVAITAFAAIFVFGIPFPLIVIGAAAFGIFVLRTSNPTVSETPTAQPRRTSLMKLVVLFAFLWFLPVFNFHCRFRIREPRDRKLSVLLESRVRHLRRRLRRARICQSSRGRGRLDNFDPGRGRSGSGRNNARAVDYGPSVHRVYVRLERGG